MFPAQSKETQINKLRYQIMQSESTVEIFYLNSRDEQIRIDLPSKHLPILRIINYKPPLSEEINAINPGFDNFNNYHFQLNDVFHADK